MLFSLLLVVRRDVPLWRGIMFPLLAATSLILSEAGVPGLSHAADWRVQGRGAISTEYNDNVFLRPENERSAVGVTLSPEIEIGGQSETWNTFLTTRLDFGRFANEKALDSEDLTVSMNNDYRTQLSQWSLDGTFKRLNTVTSEVTDSGILDSQATRTEYELLPSWTYTLSPRNSVFVDGGWNQAFFDTSALNDFTAYSVSGGWNHQLSQRDDITLRGLFSHIQNEDVSGNDSDIFGAQIEWHRKFSERLETRIAVGPRYTNTDMVRSTGPTTLTDRQSSLGVLVNGSINYDLDQRTALNASVSRAVEPSSVGAAVERDRVSLSVRHDLQPLIRLSFLASYIQSRDPNNENAIRDRDYFSLRPSIRWEFRRDWFLSGSYRFRTQEFDGESRAYSNAVFVTLSHDLQPWHFGD